MEEPASRPTAAEQSERVQDESPCATMDLRTRMEIMILEEVLMWISLHLDDTIVDKLNGLTQPVTSGARALGRLTT